MNSWKYNDEDVRSIEDMPEGAIGFAYVIENMKTGKFYIGKKSIYSTRKKKISAREKAKTKTRKTFKKVVKESDWKRYYGSSEELKKDILLITNYNFKRVILEYAFTKKYLTFIELKYQMKNDVLTRDTYNGNILGRYYHKDMVDNFIINPNKEENE